jgi:hypothetical protein
MKNIVFAIFFLCGAGAVILLAADSWQKKPYTAWDTEDIQRIMSDSPWSRGVDILMGALRMAGGPGASGEMAQSSSPLAGVGGGSGGGGGMGGRGGMAGGMGPGGAPTVRLVVRFVSALPVRQAMMRARYGDKVGNSPEAAKVLSAPDPYYVVALAGLRRPPGDVQAIKEKSALRVKGKEPFEPAQVRLENGMIVLFFPREGHPITVQDREVEVQVGLPGLASPIRRSFKLKNMVYNGKLEI